MKVYEGRLTADGFRFAIVVSRFNSFISDRLIEGAVDCLLRHGCSEDDISIFKVPGAFEIPLIARKLATKDFDAIIALGAVVRGETPHFEYVCAEVSKGISRASIETGKPIAYGIITADTLEQAADRAGAKVGNRGWEAALSAIEMVNLIKDMSLQG